MISQIDIEKTLQLQPNKECLFVSVATVLNHVVDVVNAIQKEREAERFEIQEWIDILEAVRKSVNVHEKQIDELQMKLEPEKCETPAENVQELAKKAEKECRFNPVQADREVYNALTRSENVQLDYVTTTYPTDGHTQEYYGQNGASIVIDHPLPAGYVITIREPETKGE